MSVPRLSVAPEDVLQSVGPQHKGGTLEKEGEHLHLVRQQMDDIALKGRDLAGYLKLLPGVIDTGNREAPGWQNMLGLSINGLLIDVTGLPNQTVGIPGGQIVINEQQRSLGRTVVNALHVVVTGVADVTIGSATAGVQ